MVDRRELFMSNLTMSPKQEKVRDILLQHTWMPLKKISQEYMEKHDKNGNIEDISRHINLTVKSLVKKRLVSVIQKPGEKGYPSKVNYYLWIGVRKWRQDRQSFL